MAEKIKQALITILGVFFALVGIFFLVFSGGDSIIISMGLFCMAMALGMCFALIIRKKKAKQQKELIDNGVILRASLQHITGLQVSDFLPCLIDITTDSYKFNVSNINFTLPRSKVTDVCIKTKTEVQKQYVSSFGGAAMCGALFGLAGAAYGGRAKQKSIRNISNFLVITYLGESETDIKTIIFGIDNGMTDLQIRANKMAGVKGDMSVAKKIVKDFKDNAIKSSGVSIEL